MAFIVICVLFGLSPSWCRKPAGIKKSLKQHVVVRVISSALLKKPKCPFKYFKSLIEISIYLLLLIKS